jgi:NADH-quinone oxidoreductase subunit L
MTMLVPVGVLAVLATIGGWIQFPPHWDPITKWLAPVAPSLPDAIASSTQETVTSIVSVLVGLAGIAVAWAVYSERKIAIPAVPAVRRVLENKFYFDWLYERIFYVPSVETAGFLGREFEQPVVLETGTDVGNATLETGGIVRRIQTGLLRTYVLFLAAGAAAIVLAFLIAK